MLIIGEKKMGPRQRSRNAQLPEVAGRVPEPAVTEDFTAFGGKESEARLITD